MATQDWQVSWIVKPFKDAIAALTGRLSAAEGRLTTDEGVVTGLGTTIGGVTTRLTTAEGSITSYGTRLTADESTLTAMGTTVSGFGTRLTTDEAAITSATTRIGAAEGRLTTDEANITSVTGRMTTAEGSLTALGTRTTAAESRLTTDEAAITSVTGRTTAAEGRLTTDEAAIAAAAARLTTDEANITALQQALATLTGGPYTVQDGGAKPLSAVVTTSLKPCIAVVTDMGGCGAAGATGPGLALWTGVEWRRLSRGLQATMDPAATITLDYWKSPWRVKLTGTSVTATAFQLANSKPGHLVALYKPGLATGTLAAFTVATSALPTNTLSFLGPSLAMVEFDGSGIAAVQTA